MIKLMLTHRSETCTHTDCHTPKQHKVNLHVVPISIYTSKLPFRLMM